MKIDIRPLTTENAFISFQWRNDKDVFKYTGSIYNREISLEDELNWMDKISKETNSLRYGIFVDDMYIGNVYITNIIDGIGEFHVFIGDKRYWGKGISTIASNLLLDKAKMYKDIYKVYSYVHKKNSSSLFLHKSLGFKIEKELEDQYFLEIMLSQNIS